MRFLAARRGEVRRTRPSGVGGRTDEGLCPVRGCLGTRVCRRALAGNAGRAFCRLNGDGPASNRHAFIPLVSAADRPTLELVNRLTHECELSITYLSADWALRTAGTRSRGRPDDAGCRLRRWSSSPGSPHWPAHGGGPVPSCSRWPCLPRWVPCSTQVGLVHKDIKPANVVVDPAGGRMADRLRPRLLHSARTTGAGARRRHRRHPPTWRRSRPGA